MRKHHWSWIRRYYLILIAAGLLAFCSLINKSFLTPFSIKSLLFEISIFGFLVMGQALVILTGGIDLSVGNMASMSSVIAAWLMIQLSKAVPPGLNLLFSIAATLAFCALLGFLTGCLISGLKIPPLIATLGTMWVVQGIGYYFLRGVPTTYAVKTFGTIFAGGFAAKTGVLSSIPYSLFYLILVFAVLSFALVKLRWGREIYATGGNEYAAYISGVNTERVKRRVYMISGLLAGFAGLLVGAFSAVGYPRACNGYELYAIAAVVMGGIALSGGEGRLWNAMLGILIIRLLNKLVIFSKISSYFEGMIIGTIIVVMLIIGTQKSIDKRSNLAGRGAKE